MRFRRFVTQYCNMRQVFLVAGKRMETEEISFEDLGLDEKTLVAVTKKGFETPSPIQILAIPRLLNGDANIIAKARTGTGKTAAFALPLIQELREQSDHVRALILEPTRELAVQTCTEIKSFVFDKYPRSAVVYGGASMGMQIKDLKRGAEIVVGTPGRIQDHLERGSLNIEKIDYFILDEGDEMLDMGFIEDIEAIFAKANPSSRILLFSATMPDPILKIAHKFMGEYEIIEEEGITEEPLLIDQKYWVVRENEKIEALVRLIDISPDFYGLVFTQTKVDADAVSRMLDERGYEASALHGDIPQLQREKILMRFRSKKTRVLVATDVAARGIDITGLSHVVNYSLPFDGATYVHRIGRTGRAGSSGCAVTFVRPDERRKLKFMQAAVRRASKGEMIEEEIPSVDAVIEAKRKRLFDEIKVSLGVSEPAEADSVRNGISERCGEDDLLGSVSDPSGAGGFNGGVSEATVLGDLNDPENPVKASFVFENLAEQLCSGISSNPKEILARVLENFYGKTLDRSRYGLISSVKSYGEGGQIRLFVQLGRRDGYNARSIADYFSNLLHIPGRMVDDIDISSSFSLVSLPVSAGKKVLEMSRKDKGLPHMHVDSKSGGGFVLNSRTGREGRAGRGKYGRAFPNDVRSPSGRAKRRAGKGLHKAEERKGGAELYKKKKSGEERF